MLELRAPWGTQFARNSQIAFGLRVLDSENCATKGHMRDDSIASQCLSRAQAARYVGAAGESTIRAAEEKGLPCFRDANGQVWHAPETLDDWSWRGKQPSAAEKARILRSAAEENQRSARDRERKEAIELERELAEWDAERSVRVARDEAETRMREDVRQKNEKVRMEFERTHMTMRQARDALGFEVLEGRFRLRELVDRGLLQEVPGPREHSVEVTVDGPREVETTLQLCHGSPFFLRESVFALRKETAVFAKEALREAPAEVRVSPMKDAIAGLLRLFIEGTK